MTCENPYTGVPVRSLQTMLRELSFHYPVIPRLIPDGIFGEHTLEAVMLFQREFHPPVTGQVDHGTWDAVSALFQSVRPGLSPPLPCRLWPGNGFAVAPGKDSVHLYPVQAMFRGLSQLLEGIEDAPVSGTHDAATQANLRYVQRSAQLPETGLADQATWNALARLYVLFVTFAQSPRLLREGWLDVP